VAWERVAEVFAAVLDQPVESREAFLADTCGGNVALATEVRSLLLNHGSAGDFLDPDSFALGPPLSPSLLEDLDRAPLFTRFAPDTLVGSRYRIRSHLGRGGAGEVYEAWDEELEIPVALKTLRFVLGGDSLRSLKQEAMLARAVVHPNVCRVYDLGCHGDNQNGIWFLTMEVLRGETLAEHVHSRGRLTPEEAWPLVEQMAAGLEAAHQSGIVHLDFKSGNVMLTGEPGFPQAVITDFGLACTLRQSGEDRPAARPNDIVGTPAYMAPEQVRGEAAGPAADVYALGVVLYELITGTLPFTGGTELEVAERRLQAKAPSPRGVVPDLDERWEAVIGRCLERDSRQRYARARDVAEALSGRRTVQAATTESTLPIKHSLPPERDCFVGRSVELAAIEKTIAGGARLVALLGAGGMGKTRLAMRYGWLSLTDWAGGVWYCDVTEARDLDGIALAVGQSLGVPVGKNDPVARLGHAIAGRGRCLVILDNLEQVIEPATSALRQWLARAEAASFLITSRERSGLNNEWAIDVGPMGMESGLELFIERARRLRPGLRLDAADLADAREVVRLVEGIPLAIELAAARMRVMSAAQMVAGMRKRFSLLTGGPTERHATLAAAIDGSWELLEPWEKAALAQCSVFEGGFTLGGAEAVLDLSAYSDAPWTVDVVQSLVDKSLLRTWMPVKSTSAWLPTPRFGMYVSLQEYARRKFAEEGAIPHGGSALEAVRAAEERHGEWYRLCGTEQALLALDQFGGVEKRMALENELENLTAACRRAVERGNTKTATAVYRATWEAIVHGGPYVPLMELGREILTEPLSQSEQATVLTMLGHMESAAGQSQEARNHYETALAIYRTLGSRRSEGITLDTLGTLHAGQGRREEAEANYRAALAISREVGDRHAEGLALSHLGTQDNIQGRGEEARAHHEAALAIFREIGDRRLEGTILGYLGSMHLVHGRMEEARTHFEVELAIHREVGNRLYEGIVLGNLGLLHAEQGRLSEAQVHCEAALSIHREVGNRIDEGIVLGYLGDLQNEQGQVGEAQIHLEAALAIHREVGKRLFEGIVHGNLGDLHLGQGRIAEALAHYNEAIAINREVGNRRIEGIFLGHLGNLHLGEGRMAEARAHYEAGLAILREAGVRHYEGVVLGYLGRLLYQEGRIAEAREALAQAEEILRAVNDPLELAKLLCHRAEDEHGCGNVALARTLVGEVEVLVAQIECGPDSQLGRMLATLRRTLTDR
jgi:predicted ATPase/predicted negative regulator of RcsB-dependent stress response